MEDPTSIQKRIIHSNGSIVVQAGAGTGKTKVLTENIKYGLPQRKDHKIVAAITFTVKATNEIRDRTKDLNRYFFIGTNNSFAIQEIIQPFAKDAFGEQFNKTFITDYKKEVETFENAKYLMESEKTICSVKNSNFIFEISLEILRKSKACCLYLKAKYYKLLIDEYQDCDKQMHELFLFIHDKLKIDLFIVGDTYQSLYIWRGTNPKFITELNERTDFEQEKMFYNFRSTSDIQCYSNLFLDDRVKSIDPEKDQPVIFLEMNDCWKERFDNILDKRFSASILRRRNDDAKKSCEQLSFAKKFKYIEDPPLIKNLMSDSWIYIEIAKYYIVHDYSILDFFDSISSLDEQEERKIKNKIKNKLEKLKKDHSELYSVSKEIIEMVGIIPNEILLNNLVETVNNNTYHDYFNVRENENLSMTIHSSKGLEFEQVILFMSDFNLNNIENIEEKSIHYVATSRAKKQLILLYDKDDWKSQKYCKLLNDYCKQKKINIYNFVKVIT